MKLNTCSSSDDTLHQNIYLGLITAAIVITSWNHQYKLNIQLKNTNLASCKNMQSKIVILLYRIFFSQSLIGDKSSLVLMMAWCQ